MADLYEDHPMTVVTFVVVVISMMIVQGCSPGEGPATAVRSQARARPELLEVKQFSLTKENLRLDYCVTNVFPHDIWVCVTINHIVNQDSEFSVETELDDGTLWIRRRGNLKQEAQVTASYVYAVYHRLQPGASRSDAVLLPLPVRSRSPVRVTGIPFNPVVLNRATLELGYFREDLRDLLPKEDRSEPYWLYHNRHFNGYFRGPDTAFISYISPRRWDKLDLEQSMQITISDVNMPGRIP